MCFFLWKTTTLNIFIVPQAPPAVWGDVWGISGRPFGSPNGKIHGSETWTRCLQQDGKKTHFFHEKIHNISQVHQTVFH